LKELRAKRGASSFGLGKRGRCGEDIGHENGGKLLRKDLIRGLIVVVLCCAATSAAAQNTPANETLLEDTKTIESTIAALYDVISGPAGTRNWTRFHGLFIPEGRLIFNGKNQKGEAVRRVMSTDDYEKSASEAFLKEGFFERSVANHIDRFGSVAQVFSTYESRHAKDGAPFARGINSIQLAWDGDRWWVVTILWDSERRDNPIPLQYSR
jgi:hypothetical protein